MGMHLAFCLRQQGSLQRNKSKRRTKTFSQLYAMIFCNAFSRTARLSLSR